MINARYDAWGSGAAEVRKKKMKKLQVTTEDTKDDTVRSVEGFMSSGAEACATHNEQSSEDYVEESDKNKNERAAQLGPWTWEPPTGADLQMFFERISRGENAGTPRDLRVAGSGERRRIAEHDKSRVIAEQARVAALEEERARRAKPTTRCGAFPPTTHRLRDCPYSYQKGRLPVPITTTVRLDYSDCLLIPIPHTHGRETDTFGFYWARFGMGSSSGGATTMRKDDLLDLRRAVNASVVSLTKASIAPTLDQIALYHEAKPEVSLPDALKAFFLQAKPSKHYFPRKCEDMIAAAELVAHLDLTLEDHWMFAVAPCSAEDLDGPGSKALVTFAEVSISQSPHSED